MRTLRPTTILLALVNAGLVALVVFIWNAGQARVSEPEHLLVTPLTLPNLADLNSTPMRSVDVAAIREQAVFHVHRSFYRPPPASQEIPAPEFELAGTLGLPSGQRVAFVRKIADRSNRTLHIGDDLDGWRVQLVEPERVVVTREDKSAEIVDPKATHVPGLIRGASIPRVAQSGPRVLGGPVLAAPGAVPSSTSSQARRYRPPPH
jgi:hypothetical protein